MMAGGYGRGQRQRTPCSKALMYHQSNGVIAHLRPPPIQKIGPWVLTHNLPCLPGPLPHELVTGFIFLSDATHREAEVTPMDESYITCRLQRVRARGKKERSSGSPCYLFARQSRECTSMIGQTGKGSIQVVNCEYLSLRRRSNLREHPLVIF